MFQCAPMKSLVQIAMGRQPAANLMFLAGVVLLIGLSAPAGAADSARPLTTKDLSDVKRVEAYLNNLTTLRSRFLQVASNGSYGEGTIYLQRPDQLRIDYDPPSPIRIITDGRYLVYLDRELEQITHIGIDDTPAGILLSEKVSLGKDIRVMAVERRAGILSLSLARREDPAEGKLTLVLSDNPIILRKWIVTDQQGITTNFSLLGPRFGVNIAPELFKFEQPETDRNSD
jgi:outer membrane lipoprotein-sorting protein